MRAKKLSRAFVTCATLVLCLFAASRWSVTQAKDPWHRVYTGDGTIIELNSTTLRFGSANLLRAHFRTVFSNAESIPGGQKYKTRLETIDFRLTDRKYRFVEISLLDSGGKPIQTKTVDASEDWRVLKPGGITERLFTAACSFTPLGSWKVIAYRFAEGDPKESKSTPDLDRLIGASVYLNIDSAAVGNRVCNSPSFQDKDPVEDESLRHLGIDWKSIGIRSEDARTIDVRCGGEGWQPPRSLLVKDNNKEEMLMLWDGVFLVLKRSDGGALRVTHGDGRPTLKRHQP